MVMLSAPARRRLRSFAFDPMSAEYDATRVTLSVPFEELEPGPKGLLVWVVDYDPVRGCWYEPIDLDDPWLLGQDGLPPTETNPQFHQQMVYGVASAVLEAWEIARGRRFRFLRGPFQMFPHAFEDQNAYYDPTLDAVLFGYFRAVDDVTAAVIPGQTAFTCLSHDIIAHELTHAIVHRERPWFDNPTNRDVPAFHEGFADIVAILHHFMLPGVVETQIQNTRANLAEGGPLVELAQQFGQAAGMGTALRTAIDHPDPGLLGRTLEPHDRGVILVAAVIGAFIETFHARVADLQRLASGGTGLLPAGRLHPDLVTRLSAEAVDNARRFFTVCTRAFDYLPVVDVTFGDFLRSMVTADTALFPDDADRVRATLIENFRRRGIYPEHAMTLGQESLCWEDAPPDFGALRGTDSHGNPWSVSEIVRWTAEDGDFAAGPQWEAERRRRRPAWKRLATNLQALVMERPTRFGLNADVEQHPVSVRGMHASFRPGADRQTHVDIIVQVGQQRKDLARRPELVDTGLRMWAGTTVVCDAIGNVLHLVKKPLPPNADHPFRGIGHENFRRTLDYVVESDSSEMAAVWDDRKDRMKRRLSFGSLHKRRVGGLQ